MSDEIKRVVYEVPAEVPKKNRRSRKNTEQLPIAPAKPVPVPRIKVNEMSGGTPLPILSTTTAVGGKKPATETKKVTAKPALAKPALAKPAVKIPLPYNNSPSSPAPTNNPAPSNNKPVVSAPVVKVNKAKVTTTRKAEPPKVKVVPTKKKNVTLKAKFVAKRIVVKIENSSKLRKTRDAVRRKVGNMNLKEITEKLRARGLVRPNVNPPEEMQRSMMVDILMFPTPL
jgi:hypothetical protein